jgi:hypothetical protein
MTEHETQYDKDVAAYMALEWELEEALADNPRYLADVALGPASAADDMSRTLDRYLERKPSNFPLEISQHPVLNSTNTPTLDDGENVVGWSTLLEYDDGFEREILALRDDATPLHAIHELAHLANFVDGWPADSHGAIWRTRFESLIAERYGAEVTP